MSAGEAPEVSASAVLIDASASLDAAHGDAHGVGGDRVMREMIALQRGERLAGLADHGAHGLVAERGGIGTLQVFGERDTRVELREHDGDRPVVEQLQHRGEPWILGGGERAGDGVRVLEHGLVVHNEELAVAREHAVVRLPGLQSRLLAKW